MEKIEFDKFADAYQSLHTENISLSGESPDYFTEYKIKDVAAEFPSFGGNTSDPLKILDFGAGIGNSVPFVKKHLPHSKLTCLDVSTKSLEVGQNRFPDQAQFSYFDGVRIPFLDESYDIAFASCVFHHINHQEHLPLLIEIRRILEPNGMALVYEHNPYNPLTAHAVNTCAFDINARLITASVLRRSMIAAGFNKVQIRYRVFFPRVLRVFRSLENWMKWLPLGAQYYVVAQK